MSDVTCTVDSPENETLTGVDRLVLAELSDGVSLFSWPRLNTVLLLPWAAGPDCHTPGHSATPGPGLITPSQ